MQSINPIKVTIHLLIGILIMLLGMALVNSFLGEKTIATYVDIIPMFLSLTYIAESTGVRKEVGKRNFRGWLIFMGSIVIFGLVFSCTFIFNDYLNGTSTDISKHVEHVWGYDSISQISQAISGGYLSEELYALRLGKYQELFLVYSLMFLFGGYTVTHICVWTGFFLGVSCLLFVLMAKQEDILSTENAKYFIFICAMMPIFTTTYIYHRDIIGQATIIYGLFLFITTYKKPIASFIAFPIYSYLFSIYRHPYFLIAILLFFLGMKRRDTKKGIKYLSILLVVLVCGYFIFTTDWSTFFMEDMYFDDYGSMYHGNIIKSFIQALVGYYPWTGLLTDNNWTYHIFICLQHCMTLTIIYKVFCDYRYHWRDMFKNPILCFGLGIYSTGLICAGHVAYFAAAIPFLAISLPDNTIKGTYMTFFKIILFFLFTSILYEMTGLHGAGFIN